MDRLTYKPEVPRSVAKESDPRRGVEVSSAAKDFAAVADPLGIEGPAVSIDALT